MLYYMVNICNNMAKKVHVLILIFRRQYIFTSTLEAYSILYAYTLQIWKQSYQGQQSLKFSLPHKRNFTNIVLLKEESNAYEQFEIVYKEKCQSITVYQVVSGCCWIDIGEYGIRE